MLNGILSYISLAVLFVFQTTLSRYIDICGIAPNLVFTFVLCYSMYNFPVRSGILCLVAGFITDIYSGTLPGVNALLFLYIGIAVSNFASSLVRKNLWTTAVGVLVISFLYHTVSLLIWYVVPGHSTFWYPLVRYAMPTAVYDAVFAFVISMWARWLSEDKIRGL